MSKYRNRFLGVALVLLSAFGLACTVARRNRRGRVVFTKGGFIVGVGGGHGVWIFRGHSYPFTVSGMSVGFTIGASTTHWSGMP